ncbi:MAG: glutamate racemase [Aerococcus sp.]|nr:glutamate racemase [Aerococcus sp.]
MNQPIGILDSGVGGLTVLRQALQDFPNESMVYIGDNARCPYGVRSADEISQYTHELVQFLLTFDIKLLIIACNTATAVAFDELQAKLDIPVVGVVAPGARLAEQLTENGRIIVAGTEATIASGIYEQHLLSLDPTLDVYGVECSELVPLVENPNTKPEDLKKQIATCLGPVSDVDADTLILGCTHFPLIRKEFQNYLGRSVRLIDAGRAATQDVKRQLKANHIENVTDPEPFVDFYTTGDPVEFQQVAKRWLDRDIYVQPVAVADLTREGR